MAALAGGRQGEMAHDTRIEVLYRERFGEVFGSPHHKRLRPHPIVVVAADEDDRNVPQAKISLEQPADIQAAHAWQADIDNHQIKSFLGEATERRFTRLQHSAFERRLPQGPEQKLAHVRVIFDDEDMAGGFRRRRRIGCR